MERLLFGFFLAVLASAQSFDAAVIKPAPPPDGHGMRVGSTGGPGTKDPGLYICENCNLAMLVSDAWNLRSYQLTGLDPYNGERFVITIRVPEGTTKEQFRLMMRNLVTERFKVAVHSEKKEMQMYDLLVAKNGPKLQPSVPVVPDADGQPKGLSKPEFDKDGFPVLKGTGISMMIARDHARAQWPAFTTERLASQLSSQLQKPVTDATGLKGTYDITLSWIPGIRQAPPPADANGFAPVSASDPDALPDLFQALQQQLGLRLEATKGTVDIIVVDHAEKMPTEN